MVSSPVLPTAPTRRPSSSPGRSRVAIAVLAVLALALGACQVNEKVTARNLLNRDRAAAGRAALPYQRDAQLKAQAWAERLARENRLYHSTLSHAIGARWCNLGENVGYGSSLAGVQRSFMGSSAHRANVLSRTWNGVGVGVAHRGSRVYVVHVFIRTC